ncbi:MAG: HEAT repeat domain-containing protein [Promethearchaeota archaeon]
MSKEIKDLLDTVEEENKVRAEFEQTVDVLKEEINRLNFTIKEQKLLIEDQKGKLLEFEEKTPENIKELKDTIAIQKQDLVKRYKDINTLNQQIKDLTTQLENYKKVNSQTEVNEELINTKKLIVQLTEENEQKQVQIESLKEQLENRQNYDHIAENQELIDAKKLNFQLMEENGLLLMQIETLKAQIQEANERAQSEKLHLTNKEIEALTSEIEEYKAKINYLQAKEKEIADSTKEIEEIKAKLLNSQKENEKLNQSLFNLKEKKVLISPNQSYHQLKVSPNLPKSYQISLFMKMYQLLDEINKDNVIEFLIKNLSSQNNEIKRNVIEILSEIKDKKVYDAFLKLIHDKDWLIRYNSIKAIRKFEEKGEELKNLLEKLSKDTDVDVRELAEKTLKEFSQ